MTMAQKNMFKITEKKTKIGKIQVVDDEPVMVMLLKKSLEHKCYEVISSTDGVIGLQKVINEKPDLVLLDTHMSVMNGREMLERLRKHPDSKSVKDIPAITATGLYKVKDISTAEALDVEGYVTNPKDFMLFSLKIAEILKSRHEQKTARNEI